jgi:hypothetical protein
MANALTLTEAAAATGRSRTTIRRYFDQHRFPNAFRDGDSENEPWLIPLGDLEAAGLSLVDGTVPGGDDGTSTDSTDLDRLRTDLAVARALADERERTIELLSAQLSQLQETLRAAVAH